MELGIIRQINIDVEMQASYLDYAMSVIVARALPDVRDGLKPVHRRILYAMHDLGMAPDKPYKKSARIVGEVLGKYHPHGDAAVYEAMVRMAQDFSLRYPLVDGQGNFGSIDGDNAAAMRYTEARLARIAEEMLNDIEKDTVDWTDNFDGTLKEPAVLPAALPNLLVNGASGIAVGMATNIPPHNLGEVCDALSYLIDNFDRHDDVAVEDLMGFIPGPDFPTGGVIYRYAQEGAGEAAEQVDVIAHAYAGGKGSIVMQAKAHIEDMSRNRARIVVTELPYMANKTNLLERIAELVRDGRLEGVTDLRDESDRTGMRICIEMTRTVEPKQVLADLFKLTPLQTTFGVSLLALVDGEPKLLSLKRMLLHFIEHRQEVIARRTRHDLEKARLRAHILEGLLRALDVLDEVIALIRKSRTADTARRNLIDQFKFTEIQAQAILDMQLRRLAALERRKLQDEYRETLALIKELEALLASPKKVLALIKQNLADLKTRYNNPRRTQIADRVKGTLTAMDVLPDEDVWVTLSSEGMIARQRRSGGEWERGRAGDVSHSPVLPFPHSPILAVAANTRHDVYLLSAKGQAARIHAHQVPEAPGSHYADLSGLTRRDRIAAVLSFSREEAERLASCFLLLATAQGKVKRVALADLFDAAQSDPSVIGLDEGDELLWAGVSPGGGEFMLVTATGQAIRFAEDEVRAMGLPAGGIGGIKLANKDRVAGAGCIGKSPAEAPPRASGNPPAALAVVTAAGYGKRVPLADFPAQGRNGQGVVAAKPTDKSGDIAVAMLVSTDDLLICTFAKAKPRLIPVADLPEMGRPAQGKPLAQLMVSEPVRGAFAVARSPSDEAPRLGAKGEAKVEVKAKAEEEKPAARPGGSSAKPKAAAKAVPAPKAAARKAKTPVPEPLPSTPATRGKTQAPAAQGLGELAGAARKAEAKPKGPASPPETAASAKEGGGRAGPAPVRPAAAKAAGAKTQTKPMPAPEPAPHGPRVWSKAEIEQLSLLPPAPESEKPGAAAPRKTRAAAKPEPKPPVAEKARGQRARPEPQGAGPASPGQASSPAAPAASRSKGAGAAPVEPASGKSRGKPASPSKAAPQPAPAPAPKSTGAGAAGSDEKPAVRRRKG